MPSIKGILISAAVVLLTIYAFNKFSGKNVGTLGA